MKKLLLLVIAFTLGMGVKAQCPLNTAVDFTATDVHGTEVHLFDILDSGQYVLVDFFFTSCSACIQTIPYMVQSYSMLGCNLHDVFYVEVDYGDSQAACQNWVNNHGVEYPTISGQSGGTAICNQYGISSYPTVILIAPDRSILIKDLWPISNAQTVVNQLGAYGIEEHDCTEPVGELTLTPDTLWFSNMDEDQTFTILNGTDETVTIDDVVPQEGAALEIWQPSFPYSLGAGQSLEVVVGLQAEPLKDECSYFDINVSTSLGEKKVVAAINNTALDMGLILGPYFMVSLDTVNPSLDLYIANGNAGTHTPLTITAITENASEGGPYLDIELGSELPYTLEAGKEYHFTITTLQTGEKGFATTSIDVNYDGGTMSYIVTIDGELLSINERPNVLTLFPNPANDFVILKGDRIYTIQIFNILGQKIDEFEAEGSEININTTSYENGFYVLKSGEKVMQFVVKHQ